jgi:uncharacterized protein
MIDLKEMRSFSWYKGQVEWLANRTIFLTRHGSHAYGTNIEGSDEDFKGIAIAPKDYYLGNLHKFEQAENKGGLDVVVYDIKKFVQLATECNPNVIEVLNTDPSDWAIPMNDDPPMHSAVRYGEPFIKLFEARELFLSKLARYRFSGYAFSQLKRIKTHRRWLLNPPKRKPERADFGLPETSTLEKDQMGIVEARVRKLEDQLGGEGFTKDRVEEVDENLVKAAAAAVNFPINLVPVLIAERRYNGAMRNWVQFTNWKAERNPKRAALEAKFGYDTKHAMHLVRLMRMAVEIMEKGVVIVKRPDADELLAIRNGAWDFDDLMQWATDMEAQLAHNYLDSKLPHSPDRQKIDDLLVEILDTATYVR